MINYPAEFGEINQECSTRLFENLAGLGIQPWWASSGPIKGGAVFLYYDAVHTCVRALPNCPRFFRLRCAAT